MASAPGYVDGKQNKVTRCLQKEVLCRSTAKKVLVVHNTPFLQWEVQAKKKNGVETENGEKKSSACIGRELNPGLPRGRREFYHWTTNALHTSRAIGVCEED